MQTGPGAWNDADYVSVGCPLDRPCGAVEVPPLTPVEQRAQFSMWCMLASPIILGADIRNLSAHALATLSNEAALAISQDVGGVQGYRVSVLSAGAVEVWVRPLGLAARQARNDTSRLDAVAVALFNRNGPAGLHMTLDFARDLRWPPSATAHVLDVWAGDKTPVTATGSYTARPAAAHDVVLLRVERTASV